MTLRSFDSRFWLILAALGVLFGLVVLAGSLSGLASPRLVPEDGEIGAAGPLALVFAGSMDPASVEPRLSFDPPLSGTFRWRSLDGRPNRAVSFWPDEPLQPGQTLTVRLAPGAASRSGLVLRQELTWQVKIRPAEALYLSPVEGPELWRAAPGGQAAVQLTHTDGKVFDYGVSPDGSEIVFSAYNEQSGVDLWQISRSGGEPRLLLPCQTDWCINPAYSPDGQTIAYSRRRAGAAEGEGPGVPRIWLLDLYSLTTDLLYSNPAIGGADPSWSPDGRCLAFFDGLSGGIRVVEMPTKTSFLLPSQTGQTGEWSPDSRNLIFTDVASGDAGPYMAVFVADVQTQQIRRVLEDDLNQADYSNPVWTPDGSEVAAAMRLMTGSPARQLWLISLSGGRRAITNNQLFTHSSYHWDLAGANLIYQRLEIGSSGQKPQVCVWNRASQESIILAENAFQPGWIP